MRRKKENKHGFERSSWIFCKVILLHAELVYMDLFD